MVEVLIKNIHKSFGKCDILKGVNLQVKSGELVALLGPSGSGKTTLLRILSGLESQTSGEVFFENLDQQQENNVGFVFQHYALFKHMTVFENIAFGLKMQKKKFGLSDIQIDQRVNELLRMIQLENFVNVYPSQLSGGQMQRVALARSLAVEPKILLLDEPFGALDSRIRKELRRWLRNLHKKFKVTTFFVTHDQEEAMEVADRVVIMNNGVIEQEGTPWDVYNNPASSFVYDFLGNFNILNGWRQNNIIEIVECEQIVENDKASWFKNNFTKKVVDVFKNKEQEQRNNQLSGGEYLNLYVRNHDIDITRVPEENTKYIPVKICHMNPLGPVIHLELQTKLGKILYAEVTKEKFLDLKPQANELFYCTIKEYTIFE